MKTYKIDLSRELKDVEINVKNGAKFERSIIKGIYEIFDIKVSKIDENRIKRFAVKVGNDNNSNNGNWYAHCNGYCMGLFVNYKGEIKINTYFDYRKDF